MFTEIRPDNFEQEVIEEKAPVLLACILRDLEFMKQAEILDDLSKRCGDLLKICLPDEDSIRTFSEKCGIEGTPTFVILNNGKEVGRMLGLADNKTLPAFVLRTLPFLQDGRQTDG